MTTTMTLASLLNDGPSLPVVPNRHHQSLSEFSWADMPLVGDDVNNFIEGEQKHLEQHQQQDEQKGHTKMETIRIDTGLSSPCSSFASLESNNGEEESSSFMAPTAEAADPADTAVTQAKKGPRHKKVVSFDLYMDIREDSTVEEQDLRKDILGTQNVNTEESGLNSSNHPLLQQN